MLKRVILSHNSLDSSQTSYVYAIVMQLRIFFFIIIRKFLKIYEKANFPNALAGDSFTALWLLLMA